MEYYTIVFYRKYSGERVKEAGEKYRQAGRQAEVPLVDKPGVEGRASAPLLVE